ncbi:MAG: BtpA/SgcQ family protein [Acidimicrobiia bacterium]|jgi:membrane complex biogenesis BtpA family protein|nr:MAG: BtpA/SgcQ family protein [Acidimicrobiia bacterium]
MIPELIGMVHLGALPGAPTPSPMDEVVAHAVRDAVTLADAGFDAVMVENFGDAPFFADDVPKATIASMTRAIGAVVDAVDIPVGVNVLRNDALGALAVAAATGAAMIRVNVLSGTMYTDQGTIEGRAAEVSRSRAQLCPDVAILADVFVKHATPPPGLTLVQATHDLSGRGGADALIVSGAGTGSAISLDDARVVKKAAPHLPLVVGSGATPETLADLFEVVDGVIVGTSIKVDGVTTNPVDPRRAAALVAARH